MDDKERRETSGPVAPRLKREPERGPGMAATEQLAMIDQLIVARVSVSTHLQAAQPTPSVLLWRRLAQVSSSSSVCSRRGRAPSTLCCLLCCLLCCRAPGCSVRHPQRGWSRSIADCSQLSWQRLPNSWSPSSQHSVTPRAFHSCRPGCLPADVSCGLGRWYRDRGLVAPDSVASGGHWDLGGLPGTGHGGMRSIR